MPAIAAAIIRKPSNARPLLSDYYGVDVPYIQAHVHGPDSSSVHDLDDLPTVLRDEAVAEGRVAPSVPPIAGMRVTWPSLVLG